MSTQHQPNAAMQETTPAPDGLAPCPICRSRMATYPVSSDGSPDQWCFSYALPHRSECSFCCSCDTFSTADDAAKAWKLKISGYKDFQDSKLFVLYFVIASVFLLISSVFIYLE